MAQGRAETPLDRQGAGRRVLFRVAFRRPHLHLRQRRRATRPSRRSISKEKPSGKSPSARLGTRPHAGTRSTPTIDDGRLFVETPIGDLVCLDAETGKEIWRLNILKKFDAKNIKWGLAESPLVDGQHVICCPGGPQTAVVALDKKTGAGRLEIGLRRRRPGRLRDAAVDRVRRPAHPPGDDRQGPDRRRRRQRRTALPPRAHHAIRRQRDDAAVSRRTHLHHLRLRHGLGDAQDSPSTARRPASSASGKTRTWTTITAA